MARVGFDIDGIIQDVRAFQIKYGTSYFESKGKKIVDSGALDIQTMFGCSPEEETAFWTSHLHILQYAISGDLMDRVVPFMKRLTEDGHKIYIITRRELADKDNVLGMIMRTCVKSYFKRNDIPAESFVFCSGSKVQAVLDNRLDVMFEDTTSHVNEISEHIHVFCMDAPHNRNCSKKNVTRIYDYGEETYQLFSKRMELDNRPMSDIQKALIGIPSIDKMYQKYYTPRQLRFRIPKMTANEFLFFENRDHARDEMLFSSGKKVTYAQFRKMRDRCAKALLQQGVTKNDYVAVSTANVVEGIVAILAIQDIGACAQMVHPGLSQNEIKNSLNLTKTKTLFMVDRLYPKIKDVLKDTSVENVVVMPPHQSIPLLKKKVYSLGIITSHLYEKIADACAGHFEFLKPIIEKLDGLEHSKSGIHQKILNFSKENLFYHDQPDDHYVMWDQFMKSGKKYPHEFHAPYEEEKPAMVLQSGGTTGTPKGVIISDQSCVAEAVQFFSTPNVEQYFERGDRILCVMPFFHGFGWISTFFIAACAGVTCGLVPQFSRNNVDKYLDENEPTHLVAVPTLLWAMLNNPKVKDEHWARLKLVITGGAPFPPELLTALEKKKQEIGGNFEIWNGMGQTETTCGITLDTGLYDDQRTIGIPNIGNQLKVVVPDTTEEVLEYNTPGELCSKGPTTMIGMLGAKEDKEKILKQHSDGMYVHTGDIVKQDENGIFHYVERQGDMFQCGGINIYPSEIMKVLNQHGAVKESMVVGVPNDYKGMIPKAYVVVKDICAPLEVISSIHAHCQQNLSKDALPREYEFIKSIPRSPLGKADSKALLQTNGYVKVLSKNIKGGK